ncbi:hypothetical protein C8R45DRAFT_922723 [Mycena sanguinolenta]|nr:hypothetical protein C8R45DRAFT_922723 [Mycena sanguinolenta]
MTSLFPSVASFKADNAVYCPLFQLISGAHTRGRQQNSNTRWMSGVPRIKPFKEWLRQMGSWVQRDPSFYKMLSIVSSLNSSVTDNIYVIQSFNGKFVFVNDVDSAVMNLERIIDFFTWHLRQKAAREAAFFALIGCLKSSGCGGVNRLGPITFTCDGWYSPSDVDSEELPDLIDAESASDAGVVVPEIQCSCDVFKGYADDPDNPLESWKPHLHLTKCGDTEAREGEKDNMQCQVTSHH